MYKYIGLVDLGIIAGVMFAPACISSIRMSKLRPVNDEASSEFSGTENIYALVIQGFQLSIAMLYMYFRGFNPLGFQFLLSFKSIVAGIIIFCALGLYMDFAISIKEGFGWIPKILKNNIPLISSFEDVDLSLVLFSTLNGFYEEFFFLFICNLVVPQHRLIVLVISIIIRIIIHTYQGKYIAITMSLGMGITYVLMYAFITDNLFIYIFSHLLADILGLSLFNLL